MKAEPTGYELFRDHLRVFGYDKDLPGLMQRIDAAWRSGQDFNSFLADELWRQARPTPDYGKYEVENLFNHGLKWGDVFQEIVARERHDTRLHAHVVRKNLAKLDNITEPLGFNAIAYYKEHIRCMANTGKMAYLGSVLVDTGKGALHDSRLKFFQPRAAASAGASSKRENVLITKCMQYILARRLESFFDESQWQVDIPEGRMQQYTQMVDRAKHAFRFLPTLTEALSEQAFWLKSNPLSEPHTKYLQAVFTRVDIPFRLDEDNRMYIPAACLKLIHAPVQSAIKETESGLLAMVDKGAFYGKNSETIASVGTGLVDSKDIEQVKDVSEKIAVGLEGLGAAVSAWAVSRMLLRDELSATDVSREASALAKDSVSMLKVGSKVVAHALHKVPVVGAGLDVIKTGIDDVKFARSWAQMTGSKNDARVTVGLRANEVMAEYLVAKVQLDAEIKGLRARQSKLQGQAEQIQVGMMEVVDEHDVTSGPDESWFDEPKPQAPPDPKTVLEGVDERLAVLLTARAELIASTDQRLSQLAQEAESINAKQQAAATKRHVGRSSAGVAIALGVGGVVMPPLLLAAAAVGIGSKLLMSMKGSQQIDESVARVHGLINIDGRVQLSPDKDTNAKQWEKLKQTKNIEVSFHDYPISGSGDDEAFLLYPTHELQPPEALLYFDEQGRSANASTGQIKDQVKAFNKTCEILQAHCERMIVHNSENPICKIANIEELQARLAHWHASLAQRLVNRDDSLGTKKRMRSRFKSSDQASLKGMLERTQDMMARYQEHAALQEAASPLTVAHLAKMVEAFKRRRENFNSLLERLDEAHIIINREALLNETAQALVQMLGQQRALYDQDSQALPETLALDIAGLQAWAEDFRYALEDRTQYHSARAQMTAASLEIAPGMGERVLAEGEIVLPVQMKRGTQIFKTSLYKESFAALREIVGDSKQDYKLYFQPMPSLQLAALKSMTSRQLGEVMRSITRASDSCLTVSQALLENKPEAFGLYHVTPANLQAIRNHYLADIGTLQEAALFVDDTMLPAIEALKGELVEKFNDLVPSATANLEALEARAPGMNGGGPAT